MSTHYCRLSTYSDQMTVLFDAHQVLIPLENVL